MEKADKGEVVYKDEKEVLTRRWVWRQCDKDKVVGDTPSIFIPIDVMEGLETGLCEKVMNEMDQSIMQNRYGRVVHRDILSKQKLLTEFSI